MATQEPGSAWCDCQLDSILKAGQAGRPRGAAGPPSTATEQLAGKGKRRDWNHKRSLG